MSDTGLLNDNFYGFDPNQLNFVSIADSGGSPVASDAPSYSASGGTYTPQVDVTPDISFSQSGDNWDAIINGSSGADYIESFLNSPMSLSLSGYTQTSPVDVASGGASNSSMVDRLWSGTKDVLGQDGNSVGAMILKMALSGIANIGANKQTNRAIAVREGELNLAREKANRAASSMEGVKVPGMKTGNYNPNVYSGLIGRKVSA